MNLDKEIFDISLKDVMPNRFQPREVFDEEELNGLSASIKEHGVIQPIIVRKVGDKYEIIAGERRYRASLLAGKETIPALVRDIDDREAAKIALLENLQRKDLTAIEEARTYQTILKLDNITQEELAANLGKSQSTIANKLRLLNLDETVQTALLNEKISERHARSLLNVQDTNKQRQLLKEIIEKRMTVKELDDEILRMSGQVLENNEENQMNNNFNIGSINQMPVNNVEAPVINQAKALYDKSLNIVQNQKSTIQKGPKQTMPQNNIFASLREKSQDNNNQEQTTNNIDTFTTIPAQKEPTKEQLESGIYDLRFAINNVRQAVQNTKKFGFNIETEEFDFENVYQIIIKIDKSKSQL